MPSSIFDPNYNPFTVDQGTVDPQLDKSIALKKKKAKEEEDRKKREELDKNIPAL